MRKAMEEAETPSKEATVYITMWHCVRHNNIIIMVRSQYGTA